MVDQIILQIEYLGLIVFDFDFKWNEECGCYDFGEINWDEFYNVLCGNGFCNCECLVICKKVYDDGVWFCDVLVVYVDKCVVCKVV